MTVLCKELFSMWEFPVVRLVMMALRTFLENYSHCNFQYLTFLFFELSILRLPTQCKSNCGWYSCTCQQLAMAGDGDAQVWKSFLWRFFSGSLLGGDSSSLYDWKNSI